MTRPSIGARFVWTSKMDKNIPTRRVFALRTSFSSSSTMSLTVPSAAAMTRVESGGTARAGSRKKKTTQKKNIKKSNDNHDEMKERPNGRREKIAKIQRATERGAA